MLIRNEKRQKTQLLPTPPMDRDEISNLLGKCIHLNYCFDGFFFAADTFPKLTGEGFIIVNASPSQHAGSHWTALLFHDKKFSWQIRLESRHFLCSSLVKFFNELTYSKLSQFKTKTQNSVMFSYKYPLMLNMNNNDLLRFANPML